MECSLYFSDRNLSYHPRNLVRVSLALSIPIDSAATEISLSRGAYFIVVVSSKKIFNFSLVEAVTSLKLEALSPLNNWDLSHAVLRSLDNLAARTWSYALALKFEQEFTALVSGTPFFRWAKFRRAESNIQISRNHSLIVLAYDTF